MNDPARGETVADYKRLLQTVCENRPSGTRVRLAVALGTNRSFVSQLVNPAYSLPIPAQHLETIFEVCHFSPADRAAFLAIYDNAHPGRRETGEPAAGIRVVSLTVPDFGNARRNQAIDALIAEYGRHVARLATLLKDYSRRVRAPAKTQEIGMKRLMNAVDAMLDESLDGFAAAHADIVELGVDRKFVRRRALSRGKVALISGGGSGHEPLHAGFVGHGMLDAACPGQVFTSPTPDQMVAAIEAVDTGAGSLFIVKNYEGDVMNFEMASELAAAEGRKIMTVVTNDDVAVPNSTWSTGRRGVAGTLVVEKIVGAGAEQSMGLAELQELGRKVNDRTRSFGVALTPCTVPAAGKPTFELAADEMEVGVGIHGEPGRRRSKLASADAIAEDMLGAILGDLAPRQGSECLLLVNGFGATPLMELYLMVNVAQRILAGRGLKVVRHLTGSLVTSLDMAGCSLTLSLLNEPLIRLWDAPVKTAALSW